MEFKNCIAIVTGGSSGLGEATVRGVVNNGGKAAILDLDEEKGNILAMELGKNTIFVKTDVTDETSVMEALDKVIEVFGSIQVVVNCAGMGIAQKVLSKQGPHDLSSFASILKVNLIGTFNVIRLATAKMVDNIPNQESERGVIINTASVAAFEGQIGQAAYSASKGGIVSMTLPIARELAAHGIRVVTIAPGLFETPMFRTVPDDFREALAKMIPFPSRLGYPEEFARMVECIVENPMLNGTTIRLDGAVRMQAK